MAMRRIWTYARTWMHVARSRNKPAQSGRSIGDAAFGIPRICCTSSNLSNETERETQMRKLLKPKKKHKTRTSCSSTTKPNICPNCPGGIWATIEWLLPGTKEQRLMANARQQDTLTKKTRKN